MHAKFETPAIHHAITHSQHNTTKKQKQQHHDLPRLLASSGFNRIGECDCRMLHDRSHSMQHGDVNFIDETLTYSFFY